LTFVTKHLQILTNCKTYRTCGPDQMKEDTEMKYMERDSG